MKNARWIALILMGLVLLLCGAWLPAAEDVGAVLVELDGTGSSDDDGDRLRYAWRQVGGPRVTLSDANAPTPYFRTSVPGTYAFDLVVSDGKRLSEPARVEVTVEKQNLRPEARLPESVAVELGELARIDGRGSRDADGDRLRYQWRQIGGPPLYLQSAQLGAPELALQPKQEGVYEVELIVSDGKRQSLPARCRLVVRPRNAAPVARAVSVGRAVIERAADVRTMDAASGTPVAVLRGTEFAQVGETVSLDARGSVSPEEKPLRYYWKQRSGPFVRSYDRSVEGLLRFEPPQIGLYVFELVVSDGKTDSDPVVREVRVSQTNRPPIAVIDAPAIASLGALVRLDGSRSFDREGSKVKHTWRQVSGPRVRQYFMDKQLGDAAPAFRPTETGRYQFELVVNDGLSDSRAARATVLVQSRNRPPTVRSAGNLTVAPGEAAVLQAAGNDADGDSLTYRWRQTEGPPLLTQPTVQQTLTLTPRREGTYLFELVASDGQSASEPVTCRLTVAHGLVESANERLTLPEMEFDEGELQTPAAIRQAVTSNSGLTTPASVSIEPRPAPAAMRRPTRNDQGAQSLRPQASVKRPTRFWQKPVRPQNPNRAPSPEIEFDPDIRTGGQSSWTD